MRNSLIICLSFLTLPCVGQHAINELNVSQPIPIVNTLDKQNMETFVKATMALLPGDDIIEIARISSKTQTHYTYQKTHLGIPIYQGYIKVSATFDGHVTQFHHNTVSSATAQYIDQQGNTPSNQTYSNQWIYQNGNYYLGQVYVQENTDGTHSEIAEISAQNYYIAPLSFQRSDLDTNASALVHNPNPITSAHTSYGGAYVDNNDQANPFLNQERVSKNIMVDYQNGVFVLANPYVAISEFDPPVVPPVTSSTGEFNFNRSESGFEDVNVLYHITEQQLYLRSLGFTNLVDYQIPVDAHGFGGADQSAFFPTLNPPAIVFGEGGVDDGEDADVIIHEYGHAILHSAAPNSSMGSERRAIDEAVGDYMAGSYSKLIDEHDYDKIFNWDGHNPFWDGRVLFDGKIYPQDLAGNLYLDAPMFSGSVMSLELTTNRNIAHSILLEASYGLFNFITFPEMAELMLDADSLLYNGQFYANVCYAFYDRGILDTCYANRPLSVSERTLPNEFKLMNSQEFAFGTANAQISSTQLSDIVIFNALGQEISKSNSKFFHEIRPEQFVPGTYFIKVRTEKSESEFIIQRF